MSDTAVAAVSEWTREQGGLVTTAQAEASGVTRLMLHSLTRAGVLKRIRQGVYKLTGAPWSPHDDIRAVWLLSEPGPIPPDQRRAAVCRQTAALVYGFGVLVPPALQVTLPRARRTTMRGVRWYRGELDPTEVEWVDDMRVTRPARIMADLMDDGYGDLEHLGSVAFDAIDARRMTVEEFVQVCEPRAARFGLPSGAALAEVMWDCYGVDQPMAA